MSEEKKDGLGSKVFRGSLWMIAWQWSIRLLGVVSTVILARLLVPEDYGIVAIAMLVISFFETVTLLGIDRYLISKDQICEGDYDTAWTVRLFQCCFIGFLVWFFASTLAEYFEETRLESIFIVLSWSLVLTGFQNIGIEQLKRDLNFKRLFLFGALQKLVGFGITVTLAFLLKNYWAMVIGVICFRVAGVILSYALHPYRPKISLIRIKEQWSYSQWMLVGNFAGYLRNKLDQIIVSKIYGIESMGIYSMGFHVANLPTTDLIDPAFHAVFSGFAKLKQKKAKLKQAYLKTLGAVASIVLPVAVGVAYTADELVVFVLGEKWQSTIPIIRYLVILSAAVSLTYGARAIIVVNQKIKLIAALDWLTILLLSPALFYVASVGTMENVAGARMGIGLILIPIYFFLMHMALGVNMRDILGALWRPVVACSLMMSALFGVFMITNSTGIVFLIESVIIGTISYGLALFVSWLASGKPDSGEKILCEKIYQIFKKKRIAANP